MLGLGPAVRLVSDTNADVGSAEPLQAGLGLARELLDNLDAPHLISKLGQDCRLIAQAGADLQHRLVRLRVQEIGHERNDKGL